MALDSIPNTGEVVTVPISKTDTPHMREAVQGAAKLTHDIALVAGSGEVDLPVDEGADRIKAMEREAANRQTARRFDPMKPKQGQHG